MQPTDWVLIWYSGTIALHVLVRARHLPGWIWHLSAQVGFIALIFLIVRWEQTRRTPLSEKIHNFYPIAALIGLYPQTGLLRHTIITHDLDSLVRHWDLTLFGREWYRELPGWLGAGLLELAHGAYFAYYMGLFLFAWLAFRRQKPLVREYIFTLIATLMVCNWIVILLPCSGPVPLRAETMPEGIFFIPLMDLIYSHIDQGGAAFPSMHAAAATIMTGYAIRLFPRWKSGFLLLLAAILFATVACSYHYPLDTLAGVLIGILAIRYVPQLYPRLPGRS